MPARPQSTEAVAPATSPVGADDFYPMWEVGLYPLAGWQPAYPGSDQHLAKGAVLPYAIWRGPVLRVENGVVGVRAVHTPRLEWDVSASGAFGSSANEVRARAGMPSIGTLVEIGPAVRVNFGDLVQPGHDPHDTRFELPLRAVFDASHDLAHQGWTIEPQLTQVAWRGASSSIVVAGSMLFADRRLASLFYGVDPAYATPDRPAYGAQGGLVSSRLFVYWRTRFSNRLRMQWFIEGETVRGGANTDSPLVRRQQDVGVGASLTWATFVSSERGAE
jgi:hypothetical protein